MDPYTRYNYGSSPYRAPSRSYPPSPNSIPQPLPPGQIDPGGVSYTTTIGPEGVTIYHPFSHQTPNTVIRDIQGSPATAIQILPPSAVPANAEFQQSWQSDSGREQEWQREEDMHHKREEKDAARREKERRKRERIEERELREARERERQAQYQTNQYQQGQYQAGVGRLSPYSAPLNLPGSVSPRQGGGQLPGRKSVSPYRSAGTLPGQQSVSPHYGSGNHPGPYPYPINVPSHNESGYRPPPGGDYPPDIPGGRYIRITVPSYSPYYSVPIVQSQTATRDPYSPASSSPYDAPTYLPPQPQPEEGVLPPPECFTRPLNIGQYTTKILDMDDLVSIQDMPIMPNILTTYDIFPEEWTGFMRDLLDAWLGRLPLPGSAKGVHPHVVAIDLVEHWNLSFFAPRGAELIVYKGCRRKTGRYAGRIDPDLPGFDPTASDITDSSDEAEDTCVPPGREGERRRRKGTEARRRVDELRRKHTMYLTCLRP